MSCDKFIEQLMFKHKLPLILTALLLIDLINVAHLTACVFVSSSFRARFV